MPDSVKVYGSAPVRSRRRYIVLLLFLLLAGGIAVVWLLPHAAALPPAPPPTVAAPLVEIACPAQPSAPVEPKPPAPVAAPLPALPESLNNGMLLHLPFDTDLLDHSPAKRQVERVGAVTVANQVAVFDGVGHLLIEPISLQIDHFAVAVWIRLDAGGGGHGILMQKGGDGPGKLLHLVLRYDAQPYLGFYINDLECSPEYTIKRNAWTHLVFQYAWKKQRIHVNGKLAAERWAGKYQGAAAPLQVGIAPQWDNVPIKSFGGWMSDMRIYGRPLDDAEIQALAARRPPESRTGANEDF